MFKRYTVLAVVSLVLSLPLLSAAQYGPYSSRGLLEKKLYYIDENGKTGMSTFWSLYLGKHTCSLVKEYPGEGNVTISAEMNFNFLSSLYIEGKGFSNRGKMDAEAKFAVSDADTVKVIEPEQIEYIAEFGGKIKYSGSEMTDLILLAQSNRLTVNRMLLRSFYMDKETKDLKSDKDIAIKAFAFSKDDLARAMKAK